MEGEEQDARIERLEELLEQNLKLAKDTNRILRDMRHVGRIAFWFKVIVWTIVLVLPFFFIQPIIQFIQESTGLNVPANGTSIFGVPSAAEIQKAVQQFKEQNSAQK